MNIAIVKFNAKLYALVEQKNDLTDAYYTKLRPVQYMDGKHAIRINHDIVSVQGYIDNGKVVEANDY